MEKRDKQGKEKLIDSVRACKSNSIPKKLTVLPIINHLRQSTEING